MRRLQMSQFADFVEQAGQILAGADHADGAGEDVVEDQRRDGEPRDERAHGVAHDDVHAAAHEHAAAFHVDRAHGEAEQHDARMNQGALLADGVLGDAAGIKSGRGEIAQNDGGRAPEGNERERDGGGDDDFWRRLLTVCYPRGHTV